MQTEDHPLEYGGFEGIIPEKQYGGGTVIVWDRGQWLPKDDPREGYRQGKLKFVLQGEKLRGGWTLVRSHGGKYGGRDGKQAWLLIKERDDEAREGADVVGERPESVLTERTLEQVAQQKNRVWHSTKSVGANVDGGAVCAVEARRFEACGTGPLRRGRVASKRTAKRALPSGARRAAMPAEMSAQLATLVAEVPTGGGWLHEIKYDGYRMLCRIERRPLPDLVAQRQGVDRRLSRHRRGGGEARRSNRHGSTARSSCRPATERPASRRCRMPCSDTRRGGAGLLRFRPPARRRIRPA